MGSSPTLVSLFRYGAGDGQHLQATNEGKIFSAKSNSLCFSDLPQTAEEDNITITVVGGWYEFIDFL